MKSVYIITYILTLAATTVIATSVSPPPLLEKRVQDADHIFIGTVEKVELLDDNGKVITNVTNPSDTRTNMRLRLQIKPERWLKTYLKITPNLVRMEYNTGKLILTYETEKKTWEGKKTIFLLKGDNFDPVYFLAFFAPLENEKIVEELLNTKKNK